MRDFPERLVALQPFWGLWQLEEFIGEGSYGKVYRIKREEFGETYYAALKWICLPQNQSEIQSLRNEGYDDASIADHYASVIKAFQSEIVLMSKLRGHSHIVSFEDHLFEKRENELGWDILIRMELLESLPGFFKKDRAVRDVITLGCDICDALTLCAKYKIVHRDIKPDNIFVNENGDFKLGDFGVARQMEHTQTNMSRKGTPFFMAPEVYTGREADARADQYSLGLVMHRLLNAQQIPFAPAFDRILTHQEREEALLQRLRGEALPPPLQGSEKLKQIILKASNYQPKKRFAAPEEMKAALQQTLNERENQASLFKAASGQISSKRSSLRPEAAFKKGKKSKRDKKDKTGWVLGILVGLILLLTGTGIWLLLQTPDEDVPASFENTIPAVQTPVPSTARTPMPTATPVPTETVFVALTSTPTTLPTSTFTTIPTATTTTTTTATPTATTTIAPTFTPTPTAAPTSVSTSYTALVSDGTPLPDIPVSNESNFEYRIDEAGNAVITKYTGSDTICRVPETLDGRTVVSIEGKLNESAFMECVNLQYVLLPNTIQSVGQFAFFKCDSLIGVSLPESLTSIGYSAFRDCVSLEDIVFPDTITFIGRSAFGNCLLLEHLTLPENLETLSASAFAGCRALTSVILPDSLTYIDHCVFDGCSSITNISLPTNLKKIGWAAFRNCSSLSSLVLPDGLIEIEFEAFDGCRKLKYLYIPASSIEEIGVNEGISFAFDESITLVCPENSYAEKYARENGLSYINGDYDTWKALVEKAENPSSSPIPTATPTAAHTPMQTPVEESLASEYTYHFDGTRYTPKSGTISAFTGLIAQEIPDIDKLIMEDSAAGLLRTDYNYDWQLSAEIAAVLDSSFEIEKEDRWCQMVFWQEDADTVLGLIGKTVFTLTISKKSDNTVLTKVNCVLDSLLCNIEWENDEYIEQEIVFTPGQSLTITLPQDKIAYTHDGTTVIYDWLQSTDKVSYYELVSGADCTSVTFTPKASWDGTYIEPNVRNENEFGSSIPLGITYILKSDGTQPAPGVPVVEESIASEYTYHIVGDRYGRVKGVMSNEFSISLMPDVIACEIADLYPLIVGDYGELSPDYLYEWELAKGIDAIMDCWRQDANAYLTSWPAEEEPLALELIGKTIATLTISKKSDNAVMTRVNCVLDSFIYAIEWENHDSVEQEIIFTPGQPVTISLPEDRIASTYDGATLIYMWDRSLGDSYYTITSGAGLTSITFTPEADWDGTWILPYVYREDAPHDAPNLNMIEISYILKSSGTSSAQPASTTQPEASSVSVSSEGNFEYRIDEAGNAVITKYTGSDTICHIPETLDGRTVVSIEGSNSKSAFEDCANLQYVLLPDTIQSIGQFAFFKCESLISVSLPESLTSIEHSAFKDCTSLEDIVFPDAITYIGGSAFHGCLSLQDITLPRNLEKMQAMAFAYCTALTSVFCSDSLAYIDAGTFKGCTSLKKVTLPGSLDRIGLAAFQDCKELSSIALSEHIKVIEHAAFEGCQKLDYIYIPASVEEIGVGWDGTLAFDEATTLIGPENSCAEKYAKQYNLQNNVPISQEDNFQVRINADGNAVITKYLGSEAVCNVPEMLAGRKVVAIGANAFGNCTDLRYVLLPDTIKTIENYAFSDCASLVAVSLPKSLISIGNCSFVNCTALTNLSFPDTLTEIGSLAFGSCSSLQHVILPKGIKEIAESAFAGCANLVSVTCQDSLTIIGYKAFDGCVSLKNLTLSKNLEEIGWAAFRDCRQLNSLALPDRLSTIEYAAFDGCPNLKYLYVPDSVEKIGVGADGTQAFDGETTLICPEGSYAETYAQMYFLTHATGGYSIWNGIVEMAQNMDTSMGTTEASLEYYTVLTSKRTYLYPGMDEESEAMLRIPGQMLISAVPAGDGWLKTEYAGIPGYVTTNNLKAYDLDKEYTWKEFQTMVNNALKACENGEVLVPGPKHVAAYKNGDKAITMPDGVKLIIEGGSFESMLVTNGKIELRNVTVNCAIAERCAITVSIPSKERSLELRIDENTTIAATGQYASAIGTDYNNTPSVKNAILNYRIVNNGRIESDGGSGIQIMNWGDSGEAQVYIENNGMILSHWWGGIRCRLCDQQELEIINRGSIESTHQSGIDIETGSFHIANESNAVIKGWASSGAIWAGNSYADATVSGSISNAGELQNLVVNTSVDFLPMIVYEGNDLEVFVWLTQIVRDMDEILTMDETKEIAKELLKNIKNNSGYAFEKAVIRLWTGEKEFETELEQTVYLESSEM